MSINALESIVPTFRLGPTKISLKSPGQYGDQYEYERALPQEAEPSTPTRRVHLVGERYSRRRHRLFE